MRNVRRVVASLVLVGTLGLDTYFLPGQPCWGVGRHPGDKASFWCFPQAGGSRS